MEKSIDIKRLAKCAMLHLEKDEAEVMQAAVEKSVGSCGVLAEIFEAANVERFADTDSADGTDNTDGSDNTDGNDNTDNTDGNGNGDGGAKVRVRAAALRSDEPCEADSAAAQRILKAVPETYENCIAVPRVVD